MSATANPNASSTTRPLLVRIRKDLRFERQLYQGQISWVVKDPVGLKYFRLQEEEYAVLQMLDGETSLDEIKWKIERKFAPIMISFQELQSVIGMFHQYGLIMSDAPGQGEQLFKRRQKTNRQKLLQKFSSILWIRFPGVDPERFLQWIYPKTKWFYSRWCVYFCLGMGLSALLLILVYIDEFYNRLPGFHQFFTAENVVWMMLALGLSKVLHEIGHGLLCKHFGGECHEIGFMLLVMTPCLYCDTSDSWMLKSKWQRAAIGAGGMYIELVLASICTFIWWNTEPGMLHFLCLSTMFVCSVSTVIFNSNPLLRYDGYYILSDILEVPNLAHKARSALVGLLRQWCLGIKWQDQFGLPPRKRFWFALYAVSSVLYRWLVVFGIIWFLSEVFEPYGLQVIGHMLIGMSLFGLIIMPLWKSFRYFQVPGRLRQVKLARFLATLCVITAVVLAIALIPVPHRIITTVVIQPRDAERIYVDEPGFISNELTWNPGDEIKEDEEIVTLVNNSIELKKVQLEGEVARQKERVAVAKRPEGRIRIKEALEALTSFEEQLKKRTDEFNRLKLVSPIDGYILPPPEKPEDKKTGALSTWFGTALEKRNVGTWLDKGELFCYVGDPNRMEALLVIDQGDIEFVRKDHFVEILLDEYAAKPMSGTIEEVAKIDLEVAPREISSKAGGGLTTKTDESGAERPMSASYEARVPIEGFDNVIIPGYRGHAKIHAGSRTLGQMLVRYLFKTIRFK